MSKFKVGDKVRVVKKGTQSWPEVGREFMVKASGDIYVTGHGPSRSGHADWGIYDANLELVEAAAKPEPKFAVGDTVKIIDNKSNTYAEIGKKFEVTSSASAGAYGDSVGPFYYLGKGENGGVYEKNLELVEAKFRRGQKAKIVNSGFKSEGFHAGDIVEIVGDVSPNLVNARSAHGASRLLVLPFFPGQLTRPGVEVEPKAAEEQAFEVGDVVQFKVGSQGQQEQIVREVKAVYRSAVGTKRPVLITEARPFGIWASDVKLVRSAANDAAVKRLKAFDDVKVGDLVEVSLGDRKITDRVHAISDIWLKGAGKLSVGQWNLATGNGLDVYRSKGWDLRVVEKAPEPEPVEPEKQLPTEPGLYVSKGLVIFLLKEDGTWVGGPQANRLNRVKEETLIGGFHFPLLPLHESSTPK